VRRPRPASGSRRVRAAASLVAALAAILGADAGADSDSLLFQDLSAVSGGPVDFGTPHSDIEKAACAFVDTDGDGFDEIVTLTGSGLPFGYFRNVSDGDGGRMFVPAAPGSGLDSGGALQGDGASVCAGDVDNDGDVDLYVGMGFNTLLASGRNLLLLNDGAGNFTDVAAGLGVDDGDSSTCACTFFDMDRDGDLDLLLANSNAPNLGKFGDGRTRLFRNELAETGSLAFTDVTVGRFATAGNNGAWATVTFDADGDGDADILHTRDLKGTTQLYANDGSGVFADVSVASGAGEGDDASPSTFGNDSPNGMGIAVADADNDGDLDVYIADINTNAYYRSNGDGTFTELGATAGIRGSAVMWGVAFADFDLDGWVDLHVAAGDTYGNARATVKPYLFRNLRDGTFESLVTADAGLRWDFPLHREQGTAISDFDGDGDPDLLVSRAERDGASPYLYRNDSNRGANRWIGLRLRGDGVRSNTSAIGATVRLRGRDADGALVPGAGQVREVMSSSSRGSVSSFELVFGLPPETASVDVEVRWPRPGALGQRSTAFPGLAPETHHVLVEPETAPVRVLDAEAESVVTGGGEELVAVPGGEGPGAPSPVVVLDGPAWATLEGSAEAGWSLRLAPPVAEAEAASSVLLRAGTGSDQSYQDHAVRVVSPPRVDSARTGRLGRRIEVQGINFTEDACSVLVDGEPALRVRAHGKERDADGDLKGLLVRARRAPPGAGTRTLVVTSDATGLSSATHEVPLVRRKSR
jgi:hypothetical protein